jgi:hypothetical protein
MSCDVINDKADNAPAPAEIFPHWDLIVLPARFFTERLLRLRLTGALRFTVRLRVVRLRANKDNKMIDYNNTPKYIYNWDMS